jgi:DNA-directed RNA polymerase specialized sigma24 family protein
MSRLAAGHREAFQPVFDLLWPVLRGFTARLLSDPVDAEDAAQETLRKIFSRVADFGRVGGAPSAD